MGDQLGTVHLCALVSALTALGCAAVQPADGPLVRARALPLTAATPADSAAAAVAQANAERQRFVIEVLRGIHRDFGTTLTPRQLATRLGVPAQSSESLGAWVFESEGSPFVVDADAMSIDSPIDWVRVSIGAELAIHLGDLTGLFSSDYSLLRRGSELVAVEFRSTRRMIVAAEFRTDRPALLASSPVVSVQLRRPSYEPSVARIARLVPQDRGPQSH